MSELERLKADLEVLERYHGYSIMENARADLADKIALLEADEADPWRSVKRLADIARHCNAGLKTTSEQTRRLAEFIDHLNAEIARLEKENRALGRKVETDGREIANLEQENADFLAEIRDRAKERDEALARVAELEAEAKAEDDEDLRDAEEVLADMIPPYEGLIESIEPILNPARVLATARWFLNNSDKDAHKIIAYLIMCHCGDSSNAEPYPLKGGEE